MKQAWYQWRIEQGQQPLIEERKAHLSKVTKFELLERHINNDHVPYRKDCSVCVAAQGRQRMHRRSQAKGVYAASFDLVGPYPPGQGYDTTASGRDRHHGYRYFLACAFTIPMPPYGVLPPESAPMAVPSGSPVPATEQEDLFKEVFGSDFENEDALADMLEPLGEEASVSGFALCFAKVTHRVSKKGPESPSELHEPPPLPPPSKDPSVRTRMLTLGAPLRSKKIREVLPAIQGVINRLTAAGFPVNRYHSDRAGEFRARPLVTWLRAQGIHAIVAPLQIEYGISGTRR